MYQKCTFFFWGGGAGRGGARVSVFFYEESKSKKKISVEGWGRASVSDFCLLRIQI